MVKLRRDPTSQAQHSILDLLKDLGYEMTQINGQRKLGPPPKWTKPPPDPNCEVFVGKMPRNMYEHQIYPIFSAIGEIYEIRLMMDFSGTNRGYCFVMFTEIEYAQRAIKELNNYEILPGQRIGVVACVNNCRLCVSRFPDGIQSEDIIKVMKFYIFNVLCPQINSLSFFTFNSDKKGTELICRPDNWDKRN